MTDEPRRYRFDQLDQSGVLLGLGALQLGILAAGMVGSALAISAGLPGLAAMVPAVMAFGAAFGRYAGRPLTESVPVAMRWAAGRGTKGHTWQPPVPSHQVRVRPGGTPRVASSEWPLPPVLGGLCVIEAASPWHRVSRVGMVGDRVDNTLTVLIPVPGRDFALLATEAQQDLLARWGETLAVFSRERGVVARVSWTEFAAPVGMIEHRRWVMSRHPASGTPAGDDTETEPTVVPAPSAVDESYAELLEQEGAATADHQVTVAVTVARANVRVRRTGSGAGRSSVEVFVDAAIAATDSMLRGLRSAGLQPGAPLTPAEISDVLAWRVDPDRMRRRTNNTADHDPAVLAGQVGDADDLLVGGGSLDGGLPLTSVTSWAHTRTDGSFHRCFWVAEWPRLPVRSDWLEPLLAFTGTSRRAFTMIYEPVAPSASRRRIDSESIKLESDAVTKQEKGRRVSAQHRRNQAAVAEREQELVAGFVEFDFTGLVTVSASNEDELWSGCDHVEQVAREHGLELRAMDGRHDVGWAAALPFGLSVRNRKAVRR